MYLQDHEGKRIDPFRIVNSGNELPELHRGRKIAEIIKDGAGLSLNEEHPLGITINLDPALFVQLESTGHGVEGHEDLAEGLLEHTRIKEVGCARWPVEIHARGVEAGHHQVQARVPQPVLRGLPSRPHHSGLLHTYDHFCSPFFALANLHAPPMELVGHRKRDIWYHYGTSYHHNSL